MQSHAPDDGTDNEAQKDRDKERERENDAEQSIRPAEDEKDRERPEEEERGTGKTFAKRLRGKRAIRNMKEARERLSITPGKSLMDITQIEERYR